MSAVLILFLASMTAFGFRQYVVGGATLFVTILVLAAVS
jgi:hypothetical protein